jgi:ubiquinone/menaquinone biosynthesis C-methylase UbiE
MRLFEEIFRPTSTTTILDVGGEEYNWTLISAQPKITLINTYYGRGSRGSSFHKILGDGRMLPFRDKAFDIVYSNSVIEHVGSFEDQTAFANEVRRVGKAHFIQTPDRRFPVEPHLLAPFIHYLPADLQKKLVRHFTLWGLITKPNKKRVEQMLESIRLLSEAQMKRLFDDATIVKERVCGLSKSLIAIGGR